MIWFCKKDTLILCIEEIFLCLFKQISKFSLGPKSMPNFELPLTSKVTHPDHNHVGIRGTSQTRSSHSIKKNTSTDYF